MRVLLWGLCAAVIALGLFLSAPPEKNTAGELSSPEDILRKAVDDALAGTDRQNQSQTEIALRLARYTYFRLKLGNNPFSEPTDMISHGEGSCLHYSKIYAALVKSAGIDARVYNIYEIPGVGGHNTVEVNVDGRWLHIDPSYGLYVTDRRDNRILSVEEILSSDFSDLEVFGIVERDSLERGKAPPPPQLSKLFVPIPSGKLPNFDPQAAFSTGKITLQGPEGIYVSDWTLALNQADSIGAIDEDRQAPWLDMMGLTAPDGRIVSLHELGEASLHRQIQRFTLTGLRPGASYQFELAIAYASGPDVSISAETDNRTAVEVGQPEFVPGVYDTPETVTFSIEAVAATQELTISASNGYVLIDALRAYPRSDAL